MADFQWKCAQYVLIINMRLIEYLFQVQIVQFKWFLHSVQFMRLNEEMGLKDGAY